MLTGFGKIAAIIFLVQIMTLTKTAPKTELRQYWETILLHLQGEISPANFYTWFKHTSLCSYDEEIGLIVIWTPNAFTKSWLENKYRHNIINAALASRLNAKKIELIINADLNNPENCDRVDPLQLIRENKKTNPTRSRNHTLNPRYNFDSFVVGDSNRLAYAAGKAVLAAPGESYNPFFIYGGVGLGKTHLIQAIGNALLRENRQLQILYISAETLTNDLINAIQERSTKKFKDKYRAIDVLIIDDIQFLSSKTQTQEELFHIFNTLYDNNKQIIISSDCPPREINSLNERLKSRFEMGMIADIGVPDYETRLAILRRKCQERGIIVAPEVLEFIAHEITSNVRELEGVLVQTIAQWQCNSIEPTVDAVANFLAKHHRLSSLKNNQRSISFADVINFSADYLDLAPADITSARRNKEIVTARQICMYILKHDLNMSYDLIGKNFGGKNHTTAMHAVRKITNEMQTDKALVRSVNAIRRSLGIL